jgi:peptidoglycan/xylan/chitin deacetylase (PgdA/CDA1 family)
MSAHDHRSLTTPLACGVAAAAASYAAPALSSVWRSVRRPLGVEDRTASGEGFAITFDDGPHPQGTPAMLELLAAAGLGRESTPGATFFMVGEQVRRNPALVGEVLAAGHQIGLHCDRHRNLLRLAPPQVRADIARAKATIEDAGGRPVDLYRPPYGVLNAYALSLARAHSWRVFLWSHWGRDWQAHATPDSIATLLTADVRAGAVLLLHDADEYGAPGSWRRTARALPVVLEALAAAGLRSAPL